MIHLIYSSAVYVMAVALAPLWICLLIIRPKHRAGFIQKLGFGLPRSTKRSIWIHAVSVGETIASTKLVKELSGAVGADRIFFSTTTPTGQELAVKELDGHATVFYFPFDFPCSARRAVKAVNPAVLALVDTELWPNVIHQCGKNGGETVVVNGRVSDNSYPRYVKARWVMKKILDDVSVFLMQSELDKERIISVGAPPGRVEFAGALKFDLPVQEITREERAAMRLSVGIGPGEPVLLLGSVHEGEQAAIHSALETRKSIPGLRIVIAPRRVENIGWIDKALEGSGLRAVRKTAISGAGVIADAVPVIDTFGELARLYCMADVAFVGGSFISHGGQNPLEPSACAVPVLFGPSMGNFRDAATLLVESGAGWMTSGCDEMSERLKALLSDDDARRAGGEAGRRVVRQNSGATKKTAERILAMLGE